MKAYDRVKLIAYPHTKGVVLSIKENKAIVRLFLPIAKVRNVQIEDAELDLSRVIECKDAEFGY